MFKSVNWTGRCGSEDVSLPVRAVSSVRKSETSSLPPQRFVRYDDRDTDLFLCDTNTCKFDGECLRIGNMVTCICDFKFYRATLKIPAEDLFCKRPQDDGAVGKVPSPPVPSPPVPTPPVPSPPVPTPPVPSPPVPSPPVPSPPVPSVRSSRVYGLIILEDVTRRGTDFTAVLGRGEGSTETVQKETSTCDICQFGAECDVDAEDVWCVCNIDCSHISLNPVCASDGRSYDNPCQVKEASCQKQERIEVRHLGKCRVYEGDLVPGIKPGDGHYARTDLTVEEKEEARNGQARGLYIPCPDHYKNYCIHGECQYPSVLAPPSCSCHSGFSGPQCETKEYNVLYVVPGSGKLHYVLIASIIGALQVVIICVVVLCITRKCPRTNRIHRQKANNVHFSSENTMRASTRLI
ncbi:tomoregulin-2 [Periophthalmus magnuspinnatus]|uniref:tomoregulin-2 n=1 Tax=Periophthalmus magnuspinnatus TaxID=409849 RepID=UPI002437263A|nr:tomoregulin-2 [Periophthalmus magnuspinnatus]